MKCHAFVKNTALGADTKYMTFEGTTTGPRSARPGRARRLLVALAALMAVASFSTVLTSCESTAAERWQVAALVNQSRAQAGLRQLKSNLTLDIKADNWAQKMRNACQISHSRLADGAPSNWRKLGENVGEGATIQAVHTAYLNSPGHRANIMDPAFTQIGTAAVWGNCNGWRRVFTVQVFMAT